MEIIGSALGTLERVVHYLPAVELEKLHVWLAVQDPVISVPLDLLRST
jgi:hypothetical protein